MNKKYLPPIWLFPPTTEVQLYLGTIKFTHSECRGWWTLSNCRQPCSHHHKIFPPSQKVPSWLFTVNSLHRLWVSGNHHRLALLEWCISEIIQHVDFCVWLIPLSMTFLKYTHVVGVYVSKAYPLYCWRVLYNMDIHLVRDLPADGQLHYFQFEAIMNEATVNIHIPVCCFSFPLGKYLGKNYWATC